MMRLIAQLSIAFATLTISTLARAGVDLTGPVQRVQVAADGTLWFAMDTTPATTYCKPGWYSLTMYVPKENAQYPYYFAMLIAAAAKGNNVKVANISVFDGSTSCDITKTGYGLVFVQ